MHHLLFCLIIIAPLASDNEITSGKLDTKVHKVDRNRTSKLDRDIYRLLIYSRDTLRRGEKWFDISN